MLVWKTLIREDIYYSLIRRGPVSRRSKNDATMEQEDSDPQGEQNGVQKM